MWWIRRDERIGQRASRLFHEAIALHTHGQSREAAQRLDKVVGLARGLAAKHPDDPVHSQAIASALYLLAATQIAERRADSALASLEECEQRYLQMGRAGVLDANPRIADVQLRRAAAYSLQRRGASAIIELDAAVSTYLQVTGGGPGRDLARALSRNGVIMTLFGDPDVAVGSADQAVRIYVTLQSNGGKFQIPADDAGYLNQAAACAAITHLRFGRQDIGLQAAQLGLQFGATETEVNPVRHAVETLSAGTPLDAATMAKITEILWRRLGSDDVRGQFASPDDPLPSTTLAKALAATGEDADGALARVLTRPCLECKLLIPSQRCTLSAAPAYAEKLAAIAVKAMRTMPAAGIRIGLEAHFMFATASRAQTPEMRHRFQEFGPPWAQVLLACSSAFETRNDTGMALDLAAWAGGVGRQLVPIAAINPDAARLARDCFERHGRLLIATGDRKAGEQALAAAAGIVTA